MSTNRYTNAGAPGTGATTDNMKSRAKAYFIGQTSLAFTTAYAFNIASFTDNGVGYWTLALTAIISDGMAPAPSSPANPGLCNTAYYSAGIVPMRVHNMAGTLTDEWGAFAVFGNLA